MNSDNIIKKVWEGNSLHTSSLLTAKRFDTMGLQIDGTMSAVDTFAW